MAPPPSDQSHNSIAHTSESDTSEAIKGRTRWTLDGGDYIFLLPTIAQKSYDDLGEREDEDGITENEEMAAADDADDAEAINSETDVSVLSSRAAVYRPDFNITTSLEMDEVGW